MSMYTRCPHCDTVFRVTPQQLQVSSGQVRCGRCQEVFDAFSTLTSRLPSGKLEQPSAPAGPEQPLRREPYESPPRGDEPMPGDALSAREPAPSPAIKATVPSAPARGRRS